ncbi:MAG: 16S rRNA (adenine(1518)-N(6)/adenine(1519)-N(6))-dimethyltransferase RsmA [Ferruginibacter sp.]
MYTLKKSLGQHFLKDGVIIDRIMAAVGQDACNRMLEVGPGAGALTRHLLQLPGVDFKAVELDKEKVDYLLKQYPSLEGRLIHASFLDISIPFSDSFLLVGNFPYNISTQILFRVLDWRQQVPVMIGMFQKEVAQRVAAASGSKVYGVLSVLVQAYYDVEYLFDVDRNCFTPPPQVQSGVIRLRRRESPLQVKSDKAFWLLVKTAFNQRRKTLRNAVRGLFTGAALEDPLFNKRAEALTIDDFAALTFRMQ